MKSPKIKLSILVLLIINSTVGFSNFSSEKTLISEQNSIVFVENLGQISDQYFNKREDVLFTGENNGMTFHIRNNGISYQFYNVRESVKSEINEEIESSSSDLISIYRTDINWIGHNQEFEVRKGDAIDGINNFYLASCPEGVIGVKSFKEVSFVNLYQGINIRWYEKENSLEYDYIVSPGVDYSQIRWEVKGAESIHVNNLGQLIVTSPVGTIIEEAPIAFQNSSTIEVSWLVDNNIIGFNIESYDKSKELIIDPLVRHWGTYYGGSSTDMGDDCQVNIYSITYLSGITNSTSNIATSGSHQTTFNGAVNTTDAFLTKLNANGVRQWTTYYGGTGHEKGTSCAYDVASNDIYLAGSTGSSTVISTAGSHQSVKNNSDDAFLVKFDGDGIRLWATYYGGEGVERGTDCAVDKLSNVYLVAQTTSDSTIATNGSHQSTHAGSTYNTDGFIVKFNNAGVRQWASYYGGENHEYVTGCSVDNAFNVFVTGYTYSTSGIASPNAHQSTLNGNHDGFLVKFNSTGARQWGTYYGGEKSEQSWSCAVDSSLNVYIAGHTNSTTNIASANGHKSSSTGGYEAFLVKFNGAGDRLWGTYYGDIDTIGYDMARFCFVDKREQVYLVGYTSSLNEIATSNVHQEVMNGISDAFLVQFNESGVRQWGTYYGGNNFDFGFACGVDSFYNVILIGYTESSNAIAASGHQNTYGGSKDAFVVKFEPCYIDRTITNNNNTLLSNELFASYQWIDCGNNFAPIQGATSQNFTPTSNGSYSVVITKPSCIDTATCISITSVGEKTFDISSNSLEVYPNPNNGQFSLLLSDSYKDCTILLYNSSGQLVNTWSSENRTKINLEISNPAGLYLLVVSDGKNLKESIRLVKN